MPKSYGKERERERETHGGRGSSVKIVDVLSVKLSGDVYGPFCFLPGYF